MPSVTPDRLLRRPDVEQLTGLRRSRLYDLVASGDFPAPVRLVPGGRAVAWRESDVQVWIASREPVREVPTDE